MPASFTITNGETEMFHTDRLPWDKQGLKLDNPVNSAEAIVAAGLDWDVAMKPVYTREATTHASSGFIREIPNKLALYRTDTDHVFNIFSKRYAPLQNRDAFKFFDGVVAAGEAIYHSAGSTDGGATVFMLAQLPTSLKIGDELIGKFILLANSHNGGLAVTMKTTPIRFACSNMLRAAIHGTREGSVFKAMHTTNVMNRINEAQNFLGLSEAHFELMAQGIDRLAHKHMTEGMMRDSLKDIFGAEMDPKDVSTRLTNQMNRVFTLASVGEGNKGHTAFDLYNGLVEYVDYERGRDSKRLASAWFGQGDALKAKAWDSLIAVS